MLIHPFKITKYVFFSTQFKTFVDSFFFFFFFWGGVFEPFHYFSNPVFARMVHLLISGTETMLQYILWRWSTLLLTTTKVTRNGNLHCFVAKSVVTNMRYARIFFAFFGNPQVTCVKLTHLSNFNVSFTLSCD